MQSTGHTGTHLPHPLHSSGTITSDTPWRKIAPNPAGHARTHSSHTMHSDRTMRSGAFAQVGLRRCERMRSARLAVDTAPRVPGRARATILRVAKHQFLSDEWFAVVEQLVEVHGAEAPPQTSIAVNVTVTDTPFGSERHMHLGALDGRVHWGIGHTDEADLTLTTDYETARDVLVTGDPQSGMQAFMAGKVRVQGDLAKLMAAQAAGAGPGAHGALAEAIQGITE